MVLSRLGLHRSCELPLSLGHCRAAVLPSPNRVGAVPSHHLALLCVVDSRGRFHFGPVPADDYQLRVEGEDLVAVQVRRDATEALKIEGAPPEVRVSR